MVQSSDNGTGGVLSIGGVGGNSQRLQSQNINLSIRRVAAPPRSSPTSPSAGGVAATAAAAGSAARTAGPGGGGGGGTVADNGLPRASEMVSSEAQRVAVMNMVGSGQLTIERALEVIGEHFKHSGCTHPSPHPLSHPSAHTIYRHARTHAHTHARSCRTPFLSFLSFFFSFFSS